MYEMMYSIDCYQHQMSILISVLELHFLNSVFRPYCRRGTFRCGCLSPHTTTKKAALCSWSSPSCNLLFWFWVLSRLPTSRVQNAPHSHYTSRIKCKIVRRTTVDDDDAVMKSHFVANIWNGTFTNQIITSLFCRDKLNRFFPQVWWLFCIDLFPIIVVDCPWRYGY